MASPFWAAAQEASEAVAAVIDIVVTAGADILYDHYLADREAAYGTSRVLGDLEQLVNLCFLAADGEPGNEAGKASC